MIVGPVPGRECQEQTLEASVAKAFDAGIPCRHTLGYIPSTARDATLPCAPCGVRVCRQHVSCGPRNQIEALGMDEPCPLTTLHVDDPKPHHNL